MTRALVLLPLLAGVTALGVSAREAMLARAQLDTSRTNLDSMERTVAEVTRLRALPVAAALEKRPEPGIVGHLTTSLAAAGLPSSLMTSFNPGSDAPYVLPHSSSNASASSTPAGLYRKQEARLTLEPISLQELGRFLKSWKEQHPEWSCAAIEVTPIVATSASQGSSDAIPRVRALIGIQAMYVARGGF